MRTIPAPCPISKEANKCEYHGTDPSTGEDVICECPWFQPLDIIDPNNPKKIITEKRCAIAWIPLLGHEIARLSRGPTIAVEGLTSEIIKNQKSIEKSQNGIGKVMINLMRTISVMYEGMPRQQINTKKVDLIPDKGDE